MRKFVFDWADINHGQKYNDQPETELEVPYCCGAYFIGGFVQKTFEQFLVNLKEQYRDQFDELAGRFDSNSKPSKFTYPSNDWFFTGYLKYLTDFLKYQTDYDYLYMAILNQQQSWMEPAFIDAGWRLVSDKVHRFSGYLRLYVFDGNKPKRKLKTVKKKKF